MKRTCLLIASVALVLAACSGEQSIVDPAGHKKMKETWRYASFAPPATGEHVKLALGSMGLTKVPTDIRSVHRRLA